jgi:hypothetical protein
MKAYPNVLRALAAVALIGILAGASASQDEEYTALTPRSIQGDGAYLNSLELVIDGLFAEEGSSWDGDRCLYWEDEDAFFIVDLGEEYLIQDVLLQADDNDVYTVEYSTDALTYLPFYVFYEGYGSLEQGMDTMSTDPDHPQYASVPERDPVRARYLRISASSGDRRYAMAEFQVFGYVPPVAEQAFEALIYPEGIQGYGEFSGPADLLVDGYTPAEGGSWQEDTCVSWTDRDAYFMVDLGRVLEVTGLEMQVYPGNGYRVDYSIDNINFISLLELRGAPGDIASGMDTISTRPSDPEYVADLDFFPVRARYLKIYGFEGDGPFAVSELLIYGPAALSNQARPFPSFSSVVL